MSVPHRQPQIFRPLRLRFVIIIAITLTALGLIAAKFPMALWYAFPLFGLVLVLAAFLNAGLILSDEGIAWYAVHPGWRFRKVPWSAVLDVHRGLFGLGGQIVLVVKSGRYEPWVWGTPRRDEQIEIEIWPNTLASGEEVLPSLQQWLSSQDRVDSSAVAADQNLA